MKILRFGIDLFDTNSMIEFLSGETISYSQQWRFDKSKRNGPNRSSLKQAAWKVNFSIVICITEKGSPPQELYKFFNGQNHRGTNFLIVFDLLFQMQGKSRQSISKKVRNTRFLKIVKLDQPGRYDLFCLSIGEIFLASERAGQILSKKLVPRF